MTVCQRKVASFASIIPSAGGSGDPRGQLVAERGPRGAARGAAVSATQRDRLSRFVGFQLSEGEYRAMREFAAKSGKNISQAFRDAVRSFLERQGTP